MKNKILTLLTVAFACACVLNSTRADAFLGKQDFVPSETVAFTNRGVVQGTKATEAQCNQTAGAVWAKYDDIDGECIRYWEKGLKNGVNKRAIFFFHGDILSGNSVNDKSYEKKSPVTMLSTWNNFFPDNTKPTIYMSRPGTYGSSGDHSQRRRPAEAKIISAAIDAIKKKYQIQELVITGQSGGGHVTASLITLRSDIICAVPASSPSSPKMRWQLKGRSNDTTGYADSYEPIENLKNKKFNPKLRVFVVAEENDTNVPFTSQTVLVDRLKAEKINAYVIRAEGTGPQRHRLYASGFKVASFCFDDLSDDEIQSRSVGLRG